MVDALREAHRVLRPGGALVDARPDSHLPAPVFHVRGAPRRRVTTVPVRGGSRSPVATVRTRRETLGDDRHADLAIATVKREGLFRSRRSGAFSHLLRFAGRAALQAYLDEHLRLAHRARWTVDAAARRRWRDDTFVLDRRVRYEVLDRLDAVSHSAS